MDLRIKLRLLVVLSLIIFLGKKCMHSNPSKQDAVTYSIFLGGKRKLSRRMMKTYTQFKHLLDVLQTFC